MPEKEKPQNEEKKEEEVTIEDDEAGEAREASGKEAVKRLRERLKKCSEEKREYLEGWQRAKADLINSRKRMEEEKREFRSYAKADIISDFLLVLDSFEMAIGHKKWQEGSEDWRIGVERIYAQILSIIKANDVEAVDPEGEKFDPNRHDSVGTVEVTDKKEDGMIVKVIQKGYKMGGKILRSPKVEVGELKEQ